jgi:hypothetical protein
MVIGIVVMAFGPFLWVVSGTAGSPLDALLAGLGIVLVPLGAILLGRSSLRTIS